MSWTFNGSTQYLTGTIPDFSPTTGACLLAWARVPSLPSALQVLSRMYRNGDVGLLQMYVDSINSSIINIVNGSNSSSGAVDGPDIAATTWQLWIAQFDDAADELRMFHGSQGGSMSGGTAQPYSDSWPVGAMNRIVWAALGDGSLPFAGKLAHMAIVEGPISSINQDNLLAGDNPLTLLGSAVKHYWHDSLTDLVGGVTLTNNGTATWDAGENPTVDDPPAAGGIPKTSKLTLLGVG